VRAIKAQLVMSMEKGEWEQVEKEELLSKI